MLAVVIFFDSLKEKRSVHVSKFCMVHQLKVAGLEQQHCNLRPCRMEAWVPYHTESSSHRDVGGSATLPSTLNF